MFDNNKKEYLESLFALRLKTFEEAIEDKEKYTVRTPNDSGFLAHVYAKIDLGIAGANRVVGYKLLTESNRNGDYEHKLTITEVVPNLAMSGGWESVYYTFLLNHDQRNRCFGKIIKRLLEPNN